MPTKKKESAKTEPQIPASIHPRMEFIKSVQFVGIGLDKASFCVDRALLEEARTQEMPLEIEVDITQSVLTHEEDSFVLLAHFDLAQRAKDVESKIVSISATFSAKFNLKKPASEQSVRGFAALEARLIFFPYLRHFVSDMSYRMSIDPILLPMTSELQA